MDTITPHAFDNSGGKDKPADSRDIKLGAVAAIKGYTFPATYTNQAAWASDVEYQGGQPACGAHSGAKTNGLKRGGRFSPRFQWTDIKTFDGFDIEDGTDMRSIFKSLTKTGSGLYSTFGNNVALDHQTYAHATITSADRQVAAGNRGSGYGFADDLTFKGLKQYIYDHGSVIILMRISKRFYTAPNGTTSWEEKDILPLEAPSSKWPTISGHFVVCHSYDEHYIYFINSFSDQWGRKGHGYFDESYMPFINDAGSLITLMFSKDLVFGMTDPEVIQLQRMLNKDPRTRVAASGAGSPGQETSYFGGLTLAAVKRFQGLYAISQTGNVGPLTRAVLNGLAQV